MITFKYYPNGATKAVTLSYDDGQLYDKQLINMLNTYGVKCTFHLNSARIDTPGYVSTHDIRSIYTGHEIALHTHSHTFTANIPNENILYEVLENRKTLEKIIGQVVNGMSYPSNSYNDNVINKFRNCGVLYSRTTESTGCFDLPENFMKWHPTFHHSRGTQKWTPSLTHSHTALIEKTKEFIELPEWAKNLPLFYIWGHSYEFEENSTWDVIETFCEYISKQNNIWFATNIEIYNYITALRSLRFSADCSIVYNPSALSVWIDVNSVPVKIKGGETKRLL